MDTKTRLETATAVLEKNKADRVAAEAAVSEAEAELTAARAELQRLQADATQGDALAIGKAFLLTQRLESALGAATTGSRAVLAALEAAAPALEEAWREANKLHGKKVFADLVTEYEELIGPAWALAARIREQAQKCGIFLEPRGPLLDTEWRCIAGYEVKAKKDQAPILSRFSLPKRAA